MTMQPIRRMHNLALEHPDVIHSLSLTAAKFEEAHRDSYALSHQLRQSEAGSGTHALPPEIEKQLQELGYL